MLIAAVGAAAASVVAAWSGAPASTAPAVDACAAQIEALVDRERELRGLMTWTLIRLGAVEQRTGLAPTPPGVPDALAMPERVTMGRVGD